MLRMQFVKRVHACRTEWRFMMVTQRHQPCALLFFFLLPLLNYPEAEKSLQETWWRVSAIIGIVAASVPPLALISSPSISSAFRRSNLPRHWQMNGEKMSNQMKSKYFILWIQRGEGWAAALCLVTICFLFILLWLSCGKQKRSLILRSACFYIFINDLPDRQRSLFTLFASIIFHFRHASFAAFSFAKDPPSLHPPHPSTIPPTFSVLHRKLKKKTPPTPLLSWLRSVFTFFS